MCLTLNILKAITKWLRYNYFHLHQIQNSRRMSKVNVMESKKLKQSWCTLTGAPRLQNVKVETCMSSYKRQCRIRHCEIIETFRFGDENDYEYEVWFKDFSLIVKKNKQTNKQNGLLHCTFFRHKSWQCYLYWRRGKDLSWSQNDQTSNIW